jgi:hypothetical protein
VLQNQRQPPKALNHPVVLLLLHNYQPLAHLLAALLTAAALLTTAQLPQLAAALAARPQDAQSCNRLLFAVLQWRLAASTCQAT